RRGHAAGAGRPPLGGASERPDRRARPGPQGAGGAAEAQGPARGAEAALPRVMKKEDRLLRIGVLGCGPIAQFAHFDACRKARNAELYAICDLADDLRERMSVIHQPRVSYKDYDAMLADPKVEAILIAVADQFHVP